MQITLDALTVVDAIARGGSFAAAATSLHKTTPAVTYAVQKLERDLGAAIFDRSGHRAVLTSVGQELLTLGRQVLRTMGDMECRLQRIASGWESELTIAVGELVRASNLYALIDACQQSNKGTRIRIANECTSHSWVHPAPHKADLIIGGARDDNVAEGYAVRALADVDIVFAVAASHPLAQGAEHLTEEQILEHRMVIVSDSLHEFPAAVPDAFFGRDVLAVPDLPAKYQAIVQGLGIGYLPAYVAREGVEQGRLALKSLAGLPASLPLVMHWCTANPGKVLQWLLTRLQDPAAVARLLS